jgi:hypothetical protein
MKKRLVFLVILLGLIACGGGGQATVVPTNTPQTEAAYTVDISPDDFVTHIDNPYFPRIPGARYVYEGVTEEGLERVEIEILSETREVMGIQATIMHDVVYLDGELIEETFDWFAQDKEGNVWYLGEGVDNYKDGVLQDHDGAWEAGVDGALPGIVMPANPADHVGETLRQEYYPGEAEDMADILSVDEEVTVPYGRFQNVLQTYDYTPLEPEAQEHKFFAPGIGEIRTVDLVTGEEFVLIEHTPGNE